MEQWKCFRSPLSLPGEVSPVLGRCFLAHQHQRQLNLRLLPCSSAPLSLPFHPSHLSKAWSRFWNTWRGPLGAFPHPPVATAPSQPRRAHTPHTHTDTQSLYTWDIPRKKHLIHPLNNSDNSVLSPIYMFQTRYRCYENIANIQKYIHLKTKQTPYKLLTIAIR